MHTDPSHAHLAASYDAHLQTWSRRVEEALVAREYDALCVFAGDEQAPPRDDVPYPFRVEPYFKLFIPLTHAPGSVLRLEPGRRPLLILLQPEDFWHAPPADPRGYWVERVDVCVARDAAEIDRMLGTLPRRTAAIGARRGDERFASIDEAPLVSRLDYSRAVKTQYEIRCLEQASALAARGHRAVAEAFSPRSSELELHRAFCAAAGVRESELPYNAIVAADRHAAILHYQHLDRGAPERANVLLLDAGIEFGGYASDITRTTVRGAAELEGLRDSVDAMQQALCAELRAGVDFVALHHRAHALLAGVLLEHGLLRCGADEALESGVTRTFLPHGLGHLLGLQVHDAGGRQVSPDGETRSPPAADPFLRLTRVVEPGFVLTIEPGVYFIPALLRTMTAPNRRRVDWDTVERLMPFGGVRIEDDVLVGEDGSRNLTREAFVAAQPV
jgi:Xaa-Pro dipeptidase